MVFIVAMLQESSLLLSKSQTSSCLDLKIYKMDKSISISIETFLWSDIKSFTKMPEILA